jgi:hypothetical protein
MQGAALSKRWRDKPAIYGHFRDVSRGFIGAGYVYGQSLFVALCR